MYRTGYFYSIVLYVRGSPGVRAALSRDLDPLYFCALVHFQLYPRFRYSFRTGRAFSQSISEFDIM